MKRAMLKRISAFVLAIIMTLSLCPVTALAELVPKTYESTISYVYEGDLGYTDEEAFAAYFQREMDKSLGYESPSFYSTNVLEEGTFEKEVYDVMKAGVKQIAAGEVASAVISLDSIDQGWTAEDLDIDVIYDYEIDDFTEEFYTAFDSVFVKVFLAYDCLLFDCPMELYWHDKQIGFGPGISYDGEVVTIPEVYFYVATDYAVNGAAESLDVDVTKTGATSTAIANAAAIVAANASKSDLEKLTAYKDAICEAVSYNKTAAESGNSEELGINPWQMIWVFDGDATTNVVCEGYAKAFQYLCDLSTFSGDIECHTVDGYMCTDEGDEGHMWNVLAMDDGKNYLVDVTNCDEGAIGAPDQLFMAYTNDPSNTDQEHYFTIDDTYVLYYYNEDNYGLFCDGYLTLSTTAYVASEAPEEPAYEPLYWTTYGGTTYYNSIETPIEQVKKGSGLGVWLYTKDGDTYTAIDSTTFSNETITKLDEDLGFFGWTVNGDGLELLIWNTGSAVEGTESGVVFTIGDVQYLVNLTVTASSDEEAAANFAQTRLYDYSKQAYYTAATFDNAWALSNGKGEFDEMSAERKEAVRAIVVNVDDLLAAGKFIYWVLDGHKYNGQHLIAITENTSDRDVAEFVGGYDLLWNTMTAAQKQMVNDALAAIDGQYTVDEMYEAATNRSWQPLSLNGVKIFGTCKNGELSYDVPDGYDGMYLDSVNNEPLIAVTCRPVHDRTVYLVSDEPLYVENTELPKCTNPATVDGATVYCLTAEGKNVGPTFIDVTVGDTGTVLPFLFSCDTSSAFSIDPLSKSAENLICAVALVAINSRIIANFFIVTLSFCTND